MTKEQRLDIIKEQILDMLQAVELYLFAERGTRFQTKKQQLKKKKDNENKNVLQYLDYLPSAFYKETIDKLNIIYNKEQNNKEHIQDIVEILYHNPEKVKRRLNIKNPYLFDAGNLQILYEMFKKLN